MVPDERDPDRPASRQGDDAAFDPERARPLAREFFARSTSVVAQELLGKVLASRAGGRLTAGRIVEAEAYLGSDDPGSHAATRGVTPRNKVMYGPPGSVYVYFTYGMHHMLNIVCEDEGVAGAVLVRAIEPVFGLDVMKSRRGKDSVRCLTDGPGKVAQALGVDLEANGTLLGEGPLVVYDAPVPSEQIGRSGRIGLSAGHEHELRFFLEGNAFVSRARPGVRPPRKRARHRLSD
ncbi:MAG: DNA-3-methyladenine glycosylase [Coriobacteriia bacterium]